MFSSSHIQANIFFMRLQCLQQGNRFVNDYMEEFQYLVACNDVMEDEDQLMGRYKGRLRPSLWKTMAYNPCYTLTEAIQRATTIEERHAIEIPRFRTLIPQNLLKTMVYQRNLDINLNKTLQVVLQINQLRWVDEPTCGIFSIWALVGLT